MTEQERAFFYGIALQVIDWMRDEFNTLTSYCPQCRYPILCEDHEMKKSHIEWLMETVITFKPEEKTDGKKKAAAAVQKTAPKAKTSAPKMTAAKKTAPKKATAKKTAVKAPAPAKKVITKKTAPKKGRK